MVSPARGPFQRKSARFFLLCILLTAGMAVALPRVADWPRVWLFDLYQRLDPPVRDPTGITIVDVDGESVRRIGPWPWPRDRLAQLLERASPARVIGLDILLLDPERQPDGDRDRRLAAAIARAHVVLAATRDDVPDATRPVVAVTPVLQQGSDAQNFAPRISHIAWPLAAFAAPASGVGLAIVLPERDGIIRRLQSLYAEGATLFPTFALEVLRVAVKQPMLRVRSSVVGLDRIAVGPFALDTDGNGAVWPRFSRDVPARILPAHRLLADDADASLFAGRIVLIGSSLPGLGDIHLTPLHETETGTAINAQFIASALAGDTLWRPAVADAGETLLLAVLGVASLLLSGRIPRLLQFALVALTALLLAAASYAAFARAGLLLDWTLPVVFMVAVNAVLSALAASDERRARRRAETGLADALAEVEQARRVVTQALNGTKLATLGELATVLAHELRQPIAIMSLAAENAEASLQDGNLDVEDARARLDHIIAQAQRAESIIGHLSVFGRADPGAIVPVDLHDTVADALQLVGPALQRHGIAVTTTSASDLSPARAVKVLIEQVIINLCLNAKDALSQGRQEGRAITIALAPHGRDQVEIEISDNGPGLPGSVMAHLFEPFFTTKPAGEGTGLGLSVCRRIVESLDGSIAARNGVSGGAVFTLRLPAAAIPGT